MVIGTTTIILIACGVLYFIGDVLKTPKDKDMWELIDEEFGEKEKKEETEIEVKKTWVYYLGEDFEIIAVLGSLGVFVYHIYQSFAS